MSLILQQVQQCLHIEDQGKVEQSLETVVVLKKGHDKYLASSRVDFSKNCIVILYIKQILFNLTIIYGHRQ